MIKEQRNSNYVQLINELKWKFIYIKLINIGIIQITAVFLMLFFHS